MVKIKGYLKSIRKRLDESEYSPGELSSMEEPPFNPERAEAANAREEARNPQYKKMMDKVRAKVKKVMDSTVMFFL